MTAKYQHWLEWADVMVLLISVTLLQLWPTRLNLFATTLCAVLCYMSVPNLKALTQVLLWQSVKTHLSKHCYDWLIDGYTSVAMAFSLTTFIQAYPNVAMAVS